MRYPLIVTLAVLLIAAMILIVFDVWLCMKGGAQATISWHTYIAATSEPIIPLALGLILGILLGHLFWPNRGE